MEYIAFLPFRAHCLFIAYGMIMNSNDDDNDDGSDCCSSNDDDNDDGSGCGRSNHDDVHHLFF